MRTHLSNTPLPQSQFISNYKIMKFFLFPYTHHSSSIAVLSHFTPTIRSHSKISRIHHNQLELSPMRHLNFWLPTITRLRVVRPITRTPLMALTAAVAAPAVVVMTACWSMQWPILAQITAAPILASSCHQRKRCTCKDKAPPCRHQYRMPN